MASSTLSVEVDLECSECGATLEGTVVQGTISAYSGQQATIKGYTLKVSRCEDCLKAERSAGYDEGEEAGKESGREDGEKKGFEEGKEAGIKQGREEAEAEAEEERSKHDS